jgi:hypothetical protein
LIIWHSEESCNFDFCDKNKVKETAKDLILRRGVLCAVCNGCFSLHDVYPRCLKDKDSSAEHGWVAQLHCAFCKKYPALIPDFIMPYKHYKAEVIQSVIAEHENERNIEYLDGYATDISTMRRWVKQFNERGERAVGWLISILLSLYNCQISMIKLQNKTLLKQLARLLREFRLPDSGGIIGRVNVILTTQNCGFL